MSTLIQLLCQFLALHAPLAHCLLAVVEAIAYACAIVIFRFFHDKIIWCYFVLTLARMVGVALHFGLLALGHG